jgi:hypothetical protein
VVLLVGRRASGVLDGRTASGVAGWEDSESVSAMVVERLSLRIALLALGHVVVVKAVPGHGDGDDG